MTAYQQNRNFIYCILAAIIILMGICWYISSKRTNFNEQSVIIEALQTGLKKTIDKGGRETAEKMVLITSYNQLKAVHVADSSALGKLQKLINKRTDNATIVKNHTSGSITDKKPHVTFGNKVDSLGKITSDPCNPVYKDTLNDGWTKINITACKDSVSADYTVRNEYEQTQEQSDLQGNWPFRYRTPVVKIKNLNPHTQTDEINAWAVQVPNVKKKVTTATGIGILAGIVITKLLFIK